MLLVIAKPNNNLFGCWAVPALRLPFDYPSTSLRASAQGKRSVTA